MLPADQAQEALEALLSGSVGDNHEIVVWSKFYTLRSHDALIEK